MKLSPYVKFQKKFCIGCFRCLNVCPTKALRMKNPKHLEMVGPCIGCGECIRVCPEGALGSVTHSGGIQQNDRIRVGIVSPVTYAQFQNTLPHDVLLGLKNLGFNYAFDLSPYFEMYQIATEEFIARNRKTKQTPWPVISPFCPAIVLLIAFRFPNLLAHVLPFRRPISLIGEEVHKSLIKEYGLDEDTLSMHHITCCPCKLMFPNSPYLEEKRYIDTTIGINEIYRRLSVEVDKILKSDLNPFYREHSNYFPSARSLIWGISGGEITGLDIERSLALSGLENCVNYLEKIEIGLLNGIEYLELRACPEGCVGGVLSAIDRYIAKRNIQKMTELFGLGRYLPREKVIRRYNEGWFFAKKGPMEFLNIYKTQTKGFSIDSLATIEKLMNIMQSRDCSACGYPDCRTFIEDVIHKKIKLKKCILFQDALKIDNQIIKDLDK